MRNILFTVVLALLAGCALVPRSDVGNGRYSQFFLLGGSGSTIIEVDYGSAITCELESRFVYDKNGIHNMCRTQSAASSLPYLAEFYNDTYPSMPVRFATMELCKQFTKGILASKDSTYLRTQCTETPVKAELK